jgi:LytS/YehU family sensor histidine kinase
MNLKLQVMRLEMEKGQMKDTYEREIERMKADHEKSLSSESRIQGIVGQIAPMFGFGGANSINGIAGVMSAMTEQPMQDINNLSTNTMNTQKEKIITAVNDLIKLDPNFPENLQLLVNLAKNKPAVYKQAVSILKSM